MGILAGNANLFIGMSADGDIDCVEFSAQLIEGNLALTIADAAVQMHFNAGGENSIQILLQTLTGEAISRDTIAEHTAELALFFKYHRMVTHELQIVSGGKTTGAAADNGDTLAGGFFLGGYGHSIARSVVHGHALQAANIDGSINHVAAATGLAGMLANKAAGGGEGIILADKLHCVCITTGAY